VHHPTQGVLEPFHGSSYVETPRSVPQSGSYDIT
jgi:hypothetical protein